MTEHDRTNAVVLLWPTAMFPEQRYQNSTKIDCDVCHQECWIGPAQRIKRDELQLKGICYNCAMSQMPPEQVVAQMQALTNKHWGE